MALTQRWAGGEVPTATKWNETGLPVVATTADISAPYTGQIVFATSDTRLWRYTGSAWAVFTGGPTWALYRGTTQSIPNTTWTHINWDGEDVDTGNMHSTAVNPFAVIINQPGLYSVAAKVSYEPVAAGAGDIRGIRLTVNSTTVGYRGSAVLTLVGNNGLYTQTAVMPTLYLQLAVNDVIGVQTFHNKGAAINTSVASAADFPLFTGTWLRD